MTAFFIVLILAYPPLCGVVWALWRQSHLWAYREWPFAWVVGVLTLYPLLVVFRLGSEALDLLFVAVSWREKLYGLTEILRIVKEPGFPDTLMMSLVIYVAYYASIGTLTTAFGYAMADNIRETRMVNRP